LKEGAVGERSGVVGVGNWLVDVIHTIASWPNKGDLVRISEQVVGVGGGAANVLTDLRRLEAPFALAAFGCIGDDAYATIITDHCAQTGLATDGLTTLANVTTSHTHVMSLPGDNRTFFYHAGANDALLPEHVPVDELGAAGYRLLYLGYLMLLGALDRLDTDGMTPAAHLLARARAAGMLTCVDFVSDGRPEYAAIVAPSLPHCDYLVINEIEAARATGITIRDDDDRFALAAARAAGQRLLELGVIEAVVIHAPEGAVWASRTGPVEWCPAQPLPAQQIVSAVGAGDAFCAAVIYGLHQGWPAPLLLRVAHRVAAACLTGATATSGIVPMSALLSAPEFAELTAR
jgi:sugar/nucleoside kinase (ribokinase family)